MFLLVTGGSGSGKSAFAEQQVLKLGTSTRIYLATMMCFDQESQKRIERHREMRKEKQFTTIERYTNLTGVKIPKGSTLLLECMSNLVANEMYDPKGAGADCVKEILRGICHLKEQAEHLVVVTNEICSDGLDYGEETRLYQKYLGRINRKMGEWADEAVEVVYGTPVYLKREADRK